MRQSFIGDLFKKIWWVLLTCLLYFGISSTNALNYVLPQTNKSIAQVQKSVPGINQTVTIQTQTNGTQGEQTKMMFDMSINPTILLVSILVGFFINATIEKADKDDIMKYWTYVTLSLVATIVGLGVGYGLIFGAQQLNAMSPSIARTIFSAGQPIFKYSFTFVTMVIGTIAGSGLGIGTSFLLGLLAIPVKKIFKRG